MHRVSVRAALLVCLPTLLRPLWSQQPSSNRSPDELLLKDGERLIGQLSRADDDTVVFKSNLAGEVTVKWSDITQFRSGQKLAVVPKGARKRGKELLAIAPEGTVSANAETVTITEASGQTQSVPVANTGHMLDAATFEHDVARKASLFEDWTGTVTAGASLVQATQQSRSFTTAIALARGIPPETWLEKQSRTEIDFTSSYGTVTQPATPTLKTNIYHAGAQQDEYFSATLYGFGQAMFDHNFSQGLNLQQTYAGGLGWTSFSNPVSELDLKAGLSYERQQFSSGPEQDLIGSVFSEVYNRKFPRRGWTLAEQLNISPAWNNSKALLANASATFTMPVYKRFNFTTGLIDAFLNDPPPGFRKNSLQFTTGVTYTLK